MANTRAAYQSIAVSDEVWQQLDKIRMKGESFNKLFIRVLPKMKEVLK